LQQAHKLVAQVVLSNGRDEQGAGAQPRHPSCNIGRGAAWVGRPAARRKQGKNGAW
jgi:hypothetical protein